MSLALAVSVCVPVASTALAQESPADPVDVTSDDARELADRFAPILMLKSQEEPCDALGEAFYPTSVDIVLDNPEVALRQVGRGDPVVMWAPTASDIAGLGQGFFLDVPGSPLDPGCIYERDFAKYAERTGPPTVYAHIVPVAATDDEPDRIFLQYWFYWYYNDWNNKHESDWEGIALLFEAGTVSEALAGAPVAVAYSQHAGGERAEWSSDKLDREGERPIVFSSAGSHASYFTSGLYLGRSASEGVGCDTTTGPSDRVDPTVVLLPDAVDDPDDALAWMSFGGRWGERQNGAFNAPTGPTVKARWLDPTPWWDGLRDDSVTILESDSDTVESTFCRVVAFSSNLVFGASVSPARTATLVLVLAILVLVVAARTEWAPTPIEPVRRRRRGGQIVSTALRVWAESPIMWLAVGLIYLPIVFIVALLLGLARLLPFIGPYVGLFVEGGSSVITFQAAGGLAQFISIWGMTAYVGAYLNSHRRTIHGAVRAARSVLGHTARLAGTLALQLLIVGGLALTVFGLPLAIRYAVRYQFSAQSVELEGKVGRSALARSGRLTTGRWLHTAFFSLVSVVLVNVLSTVLGLTVLVLAPDRPLAITSIVTSAGVVVLAPIAAIVMTLLYVDAVVQDEERNEFESRDDELVSAAPQEQSSA